MKKIFSVNLLLLAGFYVYGQSLPVGTPLLEEAARRSQIIRNSNSDVSSMVRPITASAMLSFDSLYYPDGKPVNIKEAVAFAKGKGSFRLLPVTLTQQVNTHHPYGWNDGAMIPAKGYQAKASAGVYAKWGPLSLQLQPELVWAKNGNFSTFPTAHTDSIWRSYYRVLNRVDNPEKYGSGSYAASFAGQSSLRLNVGKFSFGASTENLWWGPGYRNSLVMSNNAPGFFHLTLNTTAPVKSAVGTFEGQVIAGKLRGTNILPPDTGRTFEGNKLYEPKGDGDRYVNGLVVTWQPKWTKGLFLGFSRVFYQYSNNIPSSFDGYFPVVGALFKSNAVNEDKFGRDQLLSLFFRLVLPQSKAEFYGEWGRNDHSQNFRDLLVEPEHARAYIIGGRKIFETPRNKQWELFAEFTQLQSPSTATVRAQEGWYTHYQVRHGYTHRGQVLGAGIGPGSNSQTLGINWLQGIGKTGFFLERVVYNNDFYYEAFIPMQRFSSHWVDISLNGQKTWQRNRMIYSAQLSLVRSINYQWRYNEALHGDKYVNNVHAGFSVGYRF